MFLCQCSLMTVTWICVRVDSGSVFPVLFLIVSIEGEISEWFMCYVLKQTNCMSWETIIRKWRWIGHVYHVPVGALARTALRWTAKWKRQGKNCGKRVERLWPELDSEVGKDMRGTLIIGKDAFTQKSARNANQALCVRLSS
uniref:Uncharacterized protein n=1 Tax=Arion vulgaris TaxID=1028688 RepID=A0A0B7AE70_9EUPU